MDSLVYVIIATYVSSSTCNMDARGLIHHLIALRVESSGSVLHNAEKGPRRCQEVGIAHSLRRVVITGMTRNPLESL
jgi:hypothetical protein